MSKISKIGTELQHGTGEHFGASARPTPREIAWANGHAMVFLQSLCELLMCSDPWPASPSSEIEVKSKADGMARKLGFSDWVGAYHGLCEFTV